MLKTCENCDYLEEFRVGINGYCLYPFMDLIPNDIHSQGVVFNILEEVDCVGFKLKNDYSN